MKTTDIGLSLLIIILFILLLTFSSMSSKIRSVENNWEKYRCNPLIMPFVGLAGHDSSQNFIKCVQSLQTYNMGKILEPINYNIKTLGVIGEQLKESLESINTLINNLRVFIADIVKNIYSIILNLLIEIQRSLLWTKDVVIKMTIVLDEISKIRPTKPS